MSGLVSRVRECRRPELVDVEHVGVVADGEEDTDSAEVQKWAGARERYTFNEHNWKTRRSGRDADHRGGRRHVRGHLAAALEKLRALVEGEASAQE